MDNGHDPKSGELHVSRREGITINELADAYEEHAKTYYRRPDGSITEEAHDIRYALEPVRHCYGNAQADQFDSLAMVAVRNDMIDRKGWSRKTINNHVGRVKRMLKWAVVMRMIDATAAYSSLDALDGLRAGRCNAKETKRILPVADAFVEASLPFLPPTIAAVVQVQRLTGARPGEICQMRTAEIDQSGTEWVYKPSVHKTAIHDKERIIVIGPKAQAVIKPFLTGGEFVFNVDRKNYTRAIRRAAEKADQWAKGGKVVANGTRLIPHWHPHQLRHSAATQISHRFGIQTAGTVLGHSNLSVTEIYAERDTEAAKIVAAAMG
jgi:integrase